MNLIRPIKLLVLAPLLSVAVGCATAPNTLSNVDPTVDFGQYRTFGFFDPLATDEEGYESLLSNFLKVSMAQQLASRGLEFAENPDLRINFYVNTTEKVTSRTVPSPMGYYGWRDPFFYDPWPAYPAYETRIDQFTEGTLNIDVVDAKTKKLVWEGMASGRVTDTAIRQLEKTIDDAVAAIMEGFPIQVGGNPQ